jgi:hypothetical protein
LDKKLVEALERDYTTAPITPQERVMIDYVVKLTKDATKVQKDDHEKLRAAGFEDQAILQITLIASWFNYINRVADALGVAGKGKQPLKGRSFQELSVSLKRYPDTKPLIRSPSRPLFAGHPPMRFHRQATREDRCHLRDLLFL